MKFIASTLLESAADGHLSHIYEDGQLTFEQLFDIFKQVFSGKIELREKADGFNFALTMKDGILYSARNKTELKTPLNFEQTSAKFSDRREGVKNAFLTAFNDMNTALQSLSREEQDSIFNNGHNFLSLEIISANAKNIISYKQAVIVLHGINIYDDNLRKTADDPEKAKKLHAFFEQRNVLTQNTFEIKGPVVLKIKNAVQANDALTEINADLKKIIGNIPESTTLLEYAIVKIKPLVDDLIKQDLDYDILADLISRTKSSMGLPTINMRELNTKLSKKLNISSKDAQVLIKEIVPQIDDFITDALYPIWVVVVKSGILLVKCLNGFLAVNQEETAQDLKNQLDVAINALSTNNLTPNMANRFAIQLARLDKFNREVFGTEGVVFTYNGRLYKLTNTFAAINQLIGLFRNIMPITESIEQSKKLNTIIYLPGSFKPPHLAHINMIKYYAENNLFDNGMRKTVKVIVSNPQKEKRLLDNNVEITAENARNALEYLLDILQINKVQTVIDTNPITFIFEDITKNIDDFKNTLVIIGHSTKDGLDKYNFVINNLVQYLLENGIDQLKHNLFFADPNITAIQPIKVEEEDISATDFRSVLSDILMNNHTDDEIISKIKKFLPDTLTNNEILNYLIRLELF